MLKDEMTHRERVMGAIRHQPVDRLPTDYWGVAEITSMLMDKTGTKDMLGLAQKMNWDCPTWIEPVLTADRNGMWDIEMKRIPLPGGGGYYEEPAAFPLAKLETISEIEANYRWPTTDMYDYSTIKAQCERSKKAGYATMGGYISLTYFYQMIRGTEEMLLDLAADEELAEYIFSKIQEFAYAHTKKMLEAADGCIDMTQVTDDFGTQHGLIMSEAMTDRYLRRYYDENILLVKCYDAHVFHHDDGAMMAILPWLMERGIEILNPLQWHLPGWDLIKLKQDYGQRLCFHGGIDNQEVLPFGSSQDVRREVRRCVETLFSDKTGYILAPCHNIQAITPFENIMAMYDEAHKF